MKKLYTALFLIFFSAIPLFADTELKLLGGFNLSLEKISKNSPGITAAFEFSPFSLFDNDSLFWSAGVSYSSIVAKKVTTLSLFDAQFSVGYNHKIMDTVSVGAEGLFGVWSAPKNVQKDFDGVSGLLFGLRAYGNYHFFPELTAGAYIGYKNYYCRPQPFAQNFELGLLLKYNFSRGIFGSSAVVPVEEEIQQGLLFPVFYSRYADHDFGSVTFVNNEKNAIRDVEVSVFIEQFMTNPDVCARFDVIEKGESFTAYLTAFLNENILNTLISQKADAKVTVTYRSLGKLMRTVQNVELTALSRNSMTWEDDRAAAAFISGRDASASAFARKVKSIVQGEIKDKRLENLYYGAALFGALKAYGMNYVVDPSSAFTDNVGTASIDFLKFPYQTLLYRGGDCDDLTILNCALFESLGIETALITVPGHIFMAFDSGLDDSQIALISDEIYIMENNKVWIPVEITLCQDSYYLAKKTAINEWKKFKGERELIPVREAWKEFKAVGIPESDVIIEMPIKSEIIDGLNKNKY
ncbi:MAG: hypothetical protein MJ188_05580 [Treponema sp.]|nr:hypothetical protein [Treponema sp.]